MEFFTLGSTIRGIPHLQRHVKSPCRRNLSSVPESDNLHVNGLLVSIDGVALGHTPRE